MWKLCDTLRDLDYSNRILYWPQMRASRWHNADRSSQVYAALRPRCQKLPSATLDVSGGSRTLDTRRTRLPLCGNAHRLMHGLLTLRKTDTIPMVRYRPPNHGSRCPSPLPLQLRMLPLSSASSSVLVPLFPLSPQPSVYT